MPHLRGQGDCERFRCFEHKPLPKDGLGSRCLAILSLGRLAGEAEHHLDHEFGNRNEKYPAFRSLVSICSAYAEPFIVEVMKIPRTKGVR
jgi:hypothetical protein